MASDPVTLGLGVGSMLLQQMSNRSSQNAQNRALSTQDRLLARQEALLAAAEKRVNEMRESGAFSPERRLDQLDKDTARFESRDAGNLAGALRTSGYKPGDSEVSTRLDAVKTKYRETREGLANQVRREATADEMAAVQGLPAMGQTLNAAIDVYGNRASQHSQDIQSLAPAIPTLADALRGLGGKKGATASAATPGAGRLGTGTMMNYRPSSAKTKMTLADFRRLSY